MKLVDFRCKNCSAALKVASNSRYVECEYCGSVLVRELSREEENSFSAKEEAKRVADYKTKLLELKGLMIKKQGLERKVNEGRLQETLNIFERNPNLVWVLCAIFGALILFSGSLDLMSIFVAALFLLATGFAAGFVIKNMAKGKVERNEQRQKNRQYAERELRDVNDDILLLDGKFDRSYIPEKYRNEKALDQIYSFLITGQAANLQNAIMLYDGVALQEQMLNMQKMNQEQILNMQKQHMEEMAELKKMQQKKSGGLLEDVATVGAGLVGAAAVKKLVKGLFDLDDL